MGETRKTQVERQTGETSIRLEINLDGSGTSNIDTGVGFLDHMLELFARHGQFDLTVKATGDTDVDNHHTTEDVGIVLGTACQKALGDKKGITRFADVRLPMQEALTQTAVDISGRSFCAYKVSFPNNRVGDFEMELVEEFFRSFAQNAGITLHIDLVRGTNSHHISESIFKGVARALRDAVAPDSETLDEVPSTKGVI
ncbi:MAG: imidazoleglycerol-phosphate dehydratase HisB [Planctomycetota bacterium]